jgi:molecular chaperone GrpE
MIQDNDSSQNPLPTEPKTGAQGTTTGDDAAVPINNDLLEAQQKIQELTEVAKRAMADLQNFKRRSDEERAGLIVFANLQFLQGIFPVIDNFGRAFQHIPEELKENEWVKGVYSIEKQFVATLKALGLEEIDCTPGSKFDPRLHEGLMQGPGEKDTVIEYFEKGYTFKGQVVRPAKVKVGNGELPKKA